jgi:arabinogalactan oligomer/maltooligosaccharide transport system substrate-binding protein
MATGCESIWEIGDDNTFESFNDTYYSDNGFIAAKAIRALKEYSKYIGNSDDPSKLGKDKKGLGACISGIWNYGYAYEAIGDNLGCAPMPYYSVDGVKYHISSFSGYKLIGVKPQTDPKKVSVCKRIARFLSSKVCQTERFNIVNWGPTNIAALESEAVKNQPGLAALREQKPYSKPQRQCPSSWFSSVSSLTAAISKDSSDDELWSKLQAYRDNLPTFLEG